MYEKNKRSVIHQVQLWILPDWIVQKCFNTYNKYTAFKNERNKEKLCKHTSDLQILRSDG